MITFKKFTLVGLASVFLSGSIQAADTPTLKYGGRLQADYTDFHNDTYQYSDGSELRRGRLFVRGDLSENWDYKIQYDFAPDKTELKDGYIRYNAVSYTHLRAHET